MKLKELGIRHPGPMITVVAVIVAGATTWGIQFLMLKRALQKADGYMQKGFAALAVDILDSHRHSLVKVDRGCELMMSSYFQTRKADRLEWAAQSCIEAGKEVPSAFIALAASREFTSRDPEAIQILHQGIAQFDQMPDLHMRLAEVYARNKNFVAATEEFLKAAERAPNNAQILLNIMEFFAGSDHWKEAGIIAQKLKGATTDNPEIKLFIARALMKSGDLNGARTVIEQAKPMLASAKPELRSVVEQNYADVLAMAGGVSHKNHHRN